MQAQRSALQPEVRLRAAEDAAQLALALLENTRDVVALYWPVRNELSPLILAEHLHQRHIALCLPVIIEPDTPLQFRAWEPGDALHKGRYGIDEPSQKSAFVTPSILLLPLVAFDPSGTRLGTGGGYYDRTLKQLRAKDPFVQAVGFGYAFQQAEHLPFEPHDEKLDAVITEKGTATF